MGVGSSSDPVEIQGLAHFLEHLIAFGRSEKYPEVGLQNFTLGISYSVFKN